MRAISAIVLFASWSAFGQDAEDVPAEHAPAEDAPAEDAPAGPASPELAEAPPPEPLRAWGSADVDNLPAHGSADPLTEPRTPPDFDGLPDGGPTAAEVALWVPRVVLAPVYLPVRYLLYPPTSAISVAAEKNRWGKKARAFFTFRDDPAVIGVIPTALLDFGFRSSVGLYAYSTAKWAPYPRTGIHFAYGGDSWWRFTFRERIRLSDQAWQTNTALDGSQLSAGFIYNKRPDYIFYGLGADSGDQATRFTHEELGGRLDAEFVFGEHDGLNLSAAVGRHQFGPSTYDTDDPSIEQLFDVTGPDAVPGFFTYTQSIVGAELVLDSRKPLPASGSGLRVEAGTYLGLSADGSTANFVRSHVEGAAFVDLNGHNRTLGLMHHVGLIHSVTDGDVPFTELPTLGGNELMRGFLDGRYRGDSVSTTALQYTWPVWVSVDGVIFAEAGGAFGPDLDGLKLGGMAGSFGTGIRSTSDRDVAAHVLLALGTSRFDTCFEINSVRVALGVARGF